MKTLKLLEPVLKEIIGRCSRAEESLRKVLSIRPENIVALNLLEKVRRIGSLQ